MDYIIYNTQKTMQAGRSINSWEALHDMENVTYKGNYTVTLINNFYHYFSPCDINRQEIILLIAWGFIVNS